MLPYPTCTKNQTNPQVNQPRQRRNTPLSTKGPSSEPNLLSLEMYKIDICTEFRETQSCRRFVEWSFTHFLWKFSNNVTIGQPGSWQLLGTCYVGLTTNHVTVSRSLLTGSREQTVRALSTLSVPAHLPPPLVVSARHTTCILLISD